MTTQTKRESLVNDEKLAQCAHRTANGERLSRATTAKIIEELQWQRVESTLLAVEIRSLSDQIAAKDRELNSLRIQLNEMNKTISAVALRGEKTQGAPITSSEVHEREPQHGDVIPWPEADWGPLTEMVTCDWGDCEKPAAAAKLDAWGHGWLPVCNDCAKKPTEEKG